MKQYSISPDGEKFQLPEPDDYTKEFERLKDSVLDQRELGREIVVVMGVGFVGAVMAAVVADTEDESGNPTKFVIGMQRPSTRSYWKIPLLNRGVPPVQAEDPEVEPMIHRCVNDKKSLIATFTYDALKMVNTIQMEVKPEEIIRAVKRMKKKERDNFLEDLLASVSPEYLESIRTARDDYKNGRVKSHEEVFDS